MIELRPGHCPEPLRRAVIENARAALAEDLGDGDVTTALTGVAGAGVAVIVSRDDAVLAGRFWVDEVFRQVHPDHPAHQRVAVAWHKKDGAAIAPGDEVCAIRGPLAAILAGERSALNLLQTLSGTATATAAYVARAAHTGAVVLDTRKTLPGLRLAQKYAVVCGGGRNHRADLADGVLIKDNHVRACGSITEAVERARKGAAGERVEVEVETPAQAREALAAGADVILLDNFAAGEIAGVVESVAGRAKIEVSGGVRLADVAAIGACGVDYISIGALTKHLHAIDFSLEITDEQTASSLPPAPSNPRKNNPRPGKRA